MPYHCRVTSPEQITVSLEWAKKLNENGWRGNAYWLWAYHCFDFADDSDLQKPMLISRETEDHHHQWETYSAPTWSDIWFTLPHDIRNQVKEVEVTLDAAFIDRWNPAIFQQEEFRKYQRRRIEPPFRPNQTSMHDDVAAMWIHLKENNLLPPTE